MGFNGPPPKGSKVGFVPPPLPPVRHKIRNIESMIKCEYCGSGNTNLQTECKNCGAPIIKIEVPYKYIPPPKPDAQR